MDRPETAPDQPSAGEPSRLKGTTAEPWRVPWIRLTLILAAAATLFHMAWNHPTGHDVILSSLQLLAGILSTPLLLEGAWFCFGAMILYMYTLRRRHLEGDEWVVMEVDEPDSADPEPTSRPVASDGKSGAGCG